MKSFGSKNKPPPLDLSEQFADDDSQGQLLQFDNCLLQSKLSLTSFQDISIQSSFHEINLNQEIPALQTQRYQISSPHEEMLEHEKLQRLKEKLMNIQIPPLLTPNSKCHACKASPISSENQLCSKHLLINHQKCFSAFKDFIKLNEIAQEPSPEIKNKIKYQDSCAYQNIKQALPIIGLREQTPTNKFVRKNYQIKSLRQHEQNRKEQTNLQNSIEIQIKENGKEQKKNELIKVERPSIKRRRGLSIISKKISEKQEDIKRCKASDNQNIIIEPESFYFYVNREGEIKEKAKKVQNLTKSQVICLDQKTEDIQKQNPENSKSFKKPSINYRRRKKITQKKQNSLSHSRHRIQDIDK